MNPQEPLKQVFKYSSRYVLIYDMLVTSQKNVIVNIGKYSNQINLILLTNKCGYESSYISKWKLY